MAEPAPQADASGLIPPQTRTPIPGGPQDIATVLDSALAHAPDAEALVGRYSRYTYGQLDAAVNAAAAGLTALDVQAGDRVAASAANHPDIVISFLACQRLGAIWLGVGRQLAPSEKAFMLKDADACVLLAERSAVDQIESLRGDLPALRHVVDIEAGDSESGWAQLLRRHSSAERPRTRVDPWAPAVIAYTSGTTGFPKGVVHSQHNMVVVGAAGTQLNGRDFWQLGLRRGVFQPLTIPNVIVMNALLSFIGAGTCICVDRTDAVGVAEWLKAERIEAFGAAATTVYDLLTKPEIDPSSLDSLRCVLIGGGPVSEEIRAMHMQRFRRPPVIGYGITEGPAQLGSTQTSGPTPAGSSGRAHPHLEMAILGPDDELLAPGVEGEISVRARRDGPWADVYTPMIGYWKQPEATAQALRNGWMHTGDMGALDAEGNLFIKARKNDVIIRGGANIYAAEVERVLKSVAEVYDCAVVGKPDVRLGETVAAFIQPAGGIRADEALRGRLITECEQQLAKYKVPVEWIFVEEFPRNHMGKIVKRTLREQFATEPLER